MFEQPQTGFPHIEMSVSEQSRVHSEALEIKYSSLGQTPSVLFNSYRDLTFKMLSAVARIPGDLLAPLGLCIGSLSNL